MAWTAPRTWVAGEIVTAAIMNTHVRDNLLETLQRDGSIVLTAAWDAGSYQIRAETFQSDIATGTAPLTVASTTVVTNLNADQVDGQSRALTINADHTHQATGANGGQLDHGLALTGLTDDDHTQYQKENLLTTAGDVPYATGASTWARLPIGTALQLLRTNAGATAPEWASVGLTFTELAGGQDNRPNGANVWVDYDLSGIIGAGSVAVLVTGTVGTADYYQFGARNNGSALNRKVNLYNAVNVMGTLITQCDANRIIEVYTDSAAGLCVKYNILGYWS